ncbi:molybdopterin molybdotransferase MoeA [Thalassobacillus hwangdonensis]|uniref:Molybdopterin molybdenumtransferase n=1 Tax=Thalassobacillus hwangdonensis TaxID=546108 RepID=A0ABW3KVP1_9BACI
MKFNRKPIPVSEAVNKVMEDKRYGGYEEIPLNQCENRVLAEDITATHPIPPFDKSPYDGFALRSEDTRIADRDNPITLKVIEEIGAGHRASRPIRSGEAVRIMTGAEIPEGADCVAMFEICQTHERDGENYMTIKRKMDKDQNIIQQGSETKEGEILVEKGVHINPGVKALLATFGYSTVKVGKKPLVGVFATGTELLEVDEALVPGKIRNSNAYMIEAQVRRSGGEVKYCGKLDDEFDTCFNAVKRALDEVDILITTGGVSVGDYDLMPDIYEKLGADVRFNKIAMRPGSVTTVAEHEGKLLFGLSGNPSACYVGFELFVYPIIQAYKGKANQFHKKIEATLGQDFPKPNPFTRFVRGFMHFQEGKVFVSPAGMDKSAVVTSLARTDVLIMLPGGTRGFEKGDKVEAILLEDYIGQASFE